MELLRAVIVGPSSGTPHHDGLFVFDCLFPTDYPNSPPGDSWVPGKSTMLQVLVSIQANILNSRPFFNEPEHERITGAQGEQKSKKYNEDVCVLSLKMMIQTINRPPKNQDGPEGGSIEFMFAIAEIVHLPLDHFSQIGMPGCDELRPKIILIGRCSSYCKICPWGPSLYYAD
ncbi:hypothetical protein TIFTF001_022946 [Ficus carica]|uniref:UBC core domain-containing protein n=1 Tax=Ficus carica TaxID=3494 RepID=A0AA88AMR2_FICCA|nr:hypothetical protein TIFTF001_022946 [Ficus carica]